MKNFEITANDMNMGVYEAEIAHDAIVAMVKDAGYSSIADAAVAVGLDTENFVDQIVVKEIAE